MTDDERDAGCYYDVAGDFCLPDYDTKEIYSDAEVVEDSLFEVSKIEFNNMPKLFLKLNTPVDTGHGILEVTENLAKNNKTVTLVQLTLNGEIVARFHSKTVRHRGIVELLTRQIERIETKEDCTTPLEVSELKKRTLKLLVRCTNGEIIIH
mgnify:CR=1 FL=1